MSAPRAVVLAAGEGRRVWPFGTTQSKALLPAGSEPLLARTLRQLRALGAGDVAVVCGGTHERAVRAFCARTAPEVRLPTATAPGGTADALLAGWPEGAGTVLCVYGDLWLADGVLARLAEAAAARPDEAHVLALPLAGERARDWLCCDVAPDGRVTGFWGHPRAATHRVGGAFVLPAGVRAHLLANPGHGVRVPVGGMPPPEACLEESLNLFLAAGGTVRAVEPRGAVVDVDKPWHLLEANMAALDERLQGAQGVRAAPGARVSPEADVRAPVVLESGAELGARVIVRAPLYLCAGARVTDGAIVDGPTLLGPRATVCDYACVGEAVIGAGAQVRHCAEVSGVVMEGAYIVHYSEIYGVIGRGVDVGAATVCGTLRFDDGEARQRVGGPGGLRHETPRAYANASYIGDFSRTGVNVTFHPGRAVGAYSCVGPGVVVAEDVPERTLVLLRQELLHRPWGPERYGW